MEDLILKIIDIEARAQEVMRDAKDAAKTLDCDIDSETNKLQTDIENKAAAKIEALKDFELKDADEKCESIKAESKKQIERLNQKFKENKDVWVDNIVTNIISS